MGAIIEKKLRDVGYLMLGTGQEIEDLIVEIVDGGDLRQLKAVPYLIYRYNADVHPIYARTKRKGLFSALLNVTHCIFSEFGIGRSSLPKYSGYPESESLEKEFQTHYEEFKQDFQQQLGMESKKTFSYVKEESYRQRDLEFAMAKLFTPKEREIISKVYNNIPLSKTEYEYYSRKTKKKLEAIIRLKEFAAGLFNSSPMYDKELYSLKKMLEVWLEKTHNEQDVNIDRYFIWDSDKLFIVYKKKDNQHSPKQLFNTSITLKEIEQKGILDLLQKYPKMEFSQ
ncbi:hypothetical protein HZB01_00025 [Candidatus Woesearchaeota archaeon]|nr:hypothetical protein [Candidatus Woesearchaeota archaeon]